MAVVFSSQHDESGVWMTVGLEVVRNIRKNLDLSWISKCSEGLIASSLTSPH
jgi:hypothetical protein